MDPRIIGRMAPYGPSHLLMLAVLAVATIAVVALGRRLRGTRHEATAARAAGWGLLALFVAWTAWGLTPTAWDLEQSLPLHYSDALRLVTAIALITRAGWAIAVSWFWGLTLNLQALLTPDLNYLASPAVEFAAYWLLHAAVWLAPIWLTWGLGYRPTWRGCAMTFGATLAWAALAAAVNGLTGANYAYLAHAPAGPSILDALGPWPLYIVWEVALVALVWALMTLPWELTRRRAGARPIGPGGFVARAPGIGPPGAVSPGRRAAGRCARTPEPS